jgi:hypothetical protein
VKIRQQSPRLQPTLFQAPVKEKQKRKQTHKEPSTVSAPSVTLDKNQDMSIHGVPSDLCFLRTYASTSPDEFDDSRRRPMTNRKHHACAHAWPKKVSRAPTMTFSIRETENSAESACDELCPTQCWWHAGCHESSVFGQSSWQSARKEHPALIKLLGKLTDLQL